MLTLTTLTKTLEKNSFTVNCLSSDFLFINAHPFPMSPPTSTPTTFSLFSSTHLNHGLCPGMGYLASKPHEITQSLHPHSKASIFTSIVEKKLHLCTRYRYGEMKGGKNHCLQNNMTKMEFAMFPPNEGGGGGGSLYESFCTCKLLWYTRLL